VTALHDVLGMRRQHGAAAAAMAVAKEQRWNNDRQPSRSPVTTHHRLMIDNNVAFFDACYCDARLRRAAPPPRWRNAQAQHGEGRPHQPPQHFYLDIRVQIKTSRCAGNARGCVRARIATLGANAILAEARCTPPGCDYTCAHTGRAALSKQTKHSTAEDCFTIPYYRRLTWFDLSTIATAVAPRWQARTTTGRTPTYKRAAPPGYTHAAFVASPIRTAISALFALSPRRIL